MLVVGMVKRFASDRRLIAALWLLATYLLVLYAAIRWGHPSPRPPGFAGLGV